MINKDIFTGILEIAGEKDTLDLALKLHPKTKQVIFVIDTTPSGAYRWKQLSALFDDYPDINFIRIDDSYSILEIEDRISSLPDDTIVFFATLYRDKTGRYITLAEGASRISKASNRPIYTFHNQVLLEGTIGGRVLGGLHHGEEAAKMALRILLGEKVSDIPVVDYSITEYIFDSQQLKRFNIELSDLPEDSIIINEPFSFYKEYKHGIWAGIAFILILIVIIITQYQNNVKQKRAKAKIQEQVELLDNMSNKLKKTIADLDNRSKELTRSNEELQTFAFIASHDLQEPLRTIGSYAELLEVRYKDKLDDEANTCIGYIVAGVERMKILIISLLEVSRIDTRGEPFVCINSKDIISQAIKNLEATISESKAKIICGDMPEVRVDVAQFVHIFQNLIANAIKFRGDEAPEIYIEAQSKNSNWQFSIKDNGIGLDAKYAERIFVIFRRLHTREEYPGVGIGLAVCKRIIERHNGQIWVESEEGKGATFYFSIPK